MADDHSLCRLTLNRIHYSMGANEVV